MKAIKIIGALLALNITKLLTATGVLLSFFFIGAFAYQLSIIMVNETDMNSILALVCALLMIVIMVFLGAIKLIITLKK